MITKEGYVFVYRHRQREMLFGPRVNEKNGEVESIEMNDLTFYYDRIKDWVIRDLSLNNEYESTAPMYFINHLIYTCVGIAHFRSGLNWFPEKDIMSIKQS